jgi:type VI protein secretion system component VasA
MSDDQLAKKRAELEHLRQEANVLKEAMMPEQAAAKLVTYMAGKTDPFNER